MPGPYSYSQLVGYDPPSKYSMNRLIRHSTWGSRTVPVLGHCTPFLSVHPYFIQHLLVREDFSSPGSVVPASLVCGRHACVLLGPCTFTRCLPQLH